MQRCSNKVEKEAASGVPEGEKDAADLAMATADDTNVEEWVPGQLIELPQDYVDSILARKRRVLEEDPDEYYARMINDPDRPEVYTPEFLEDERQLMRDIAERYRISGDYLEEFQAWVRVQLETKGRVLVDDTFLEQRIRFRQEFKEDWAALRQEFKEDWAAMFRDEEEQARVAVESK